MGDYAGLVVDFYLPVPKSWSKKEKAAAYGSMHRVKFDIDNGAKALMDSLEEAGVLENDSRLAHLTAKKWYVREGEEPRIEFRLLTYDELINQAL